eukprot:70162-Amphidinium_carterae.1
MVRRSCPLQKPKGASLVTGIVVQTSHLLSHWGRLHTWGALSLANSPERTLVLPRPEVLLQGPARLASQ